MTTMSWKTHVGVWLGSAFRVAAWCLRVTRGFKLKLILSIVMANKREIALVQRVLESLRQRTSYARLF